MVFSKLLPIQTLAASLALALGLVGVAALVGVGEAAAQEDDWTGVAEFTVEADVLQGQLPGEPTESADARRSLQQILDSASIRISVASDGSRQQQLIWNDATLLDLRADVSRMPELSHAGYEHPDPADVDPFELPVAARVDLAVAMRMASDLGLSPGAGEGFPLLEELAPDGGEGARRLPQDLLPVLGTVLRGGWIAVEGPLDPAQLPAGRSPEDAQVAVWGVIDDHVVITEPDADQSLQEWEAAIDVPGLLTGLCSLAESSSSGRVTSCDEHLDAPLLENGEAVVSVRVDDTADPIGLLHDVSPDATLTWSELFGLARQLR